MTVEGIETMAMEGLPMPGGLNLAEQVLFQGFRRLYASAAMGRVTAEQGSVEKNAMLTEFRRASEMFADAKRIVERNGRMWKEIEAAGNRFGKERTVESAEAFHKAVYGVGLLPKNVAEDRRKK